MQPRPARPASPSTSATSSSWPVVATTLGLSIALALIAIGFSAMPTTAQIAPPPDNQNDASGAFTPIIGVDPEALDFGCVDVGGTSNLTLDVFNADGGPGTAMEITAFTIEPAEFELVSPPMPPFELLEDGVLPLTVRFAPSASGNVQGTLTIESSNAVNSPLSVPLSGIGNNAPTCDAGGPYAGTTGQPIQFDGSASSDDGTIDTYDWDFGDGNTDNGVMPMHTYATGGTYTATLCVTDDCGVISCCTASVDVTDEGGVTPVIGVDPSSLDFGDCIAIGDCVTLDLELFNATNSPASVLTVTDLLASPSDFQLIAGPDLPVDLPGDGTSVTLTLEFCPSTAGMQSGSLTIAASGAENSPLQVPLAGSGTADPVCAAGGPYAAAAGVDINFDGTGSSSPGGTIATYDWDFGDGASDTGATPTHAYNAAGTYTVTLCVTDDCGVTSCCTALATISGEACNDYTVSGSVRYTTCNDLDSRPPNPRPIQETTLDIVESCDGATSSSAVVIGDPGTYEFDTCADCEYTVTPSKPRLLDGTDFINASDAQLVMAYVAELDSLDLCALDAQSYDATGLGDVVYCEPGPFYDIGFIPGPDYPTDPSDYVILPQKVNADVSADGIITEEDADLILAYAVGDPSTLGEWNYLCDEQVLTPQADIAFNNHRGFLSGDVSGDWQGWPLGSEPTFAAIDLQAAPSLSTLSITLRVQSFSELRAFDLDLGMDSDVLAFTGATPIGDAADFRIASRAEGRRVRVAMAGLSGPRSGAFLRLDFAVLQPRLDTPELVSLRKVIVNGAVLEQNIISVADELGAPGSITDASIVSVHPNPFNPATQIEFYLPADGAAKLEVYSVTGQLVRTLVNERLTSGLQRLTWDGTDDQGVAQSSGLYLARLTTPGQVDTRKLLLLK